MGLDMYLHGEKFFLPDWENPKNNRTEDGLKVASLEVELGYWRKHPNLHGYIVQTFANGVDECQKIYLTVEHLQNLIEATKTRKLPHTEGFFFGQSDLTDDEIADDVEQLERAIKWLEFKEPKVMRSVHYCASW